MQQPEELSQEKLTIKQSLLAVPSDSMAKSSTQVSESASPKAAKPAEAELTHRQKKGLSLKQELEEHILKIESYQKTFTDSSGLEVFVPPAVRNSQEAGAGAMLLRYRAEGVTPEQFMKCFDNLSERKWNQFFPQSCSRFSLLLLLRNALKEDNISFLAFVSCRRNDSSESLSSPPLRGRGRKGSLILLCL